MPTIPKIVNRGGAGLLVKSKAENSTLPAGPDIKVVKDKIAAGLKDLITPIDKIKFDPVNARLHPERNMQAIKDSLCQYGQVKPIVVRKQTNVAMAGNGTLQAAKELGWTKIAAVFIAMTDIEAAGYGIADNRTAELATWNLEVLSKLTRLENEMGHPSIGWSPEEVAALRMDFVSAEETTPTLNLSERFIVPPFSVLDARRGYLSLIHI